jgi:hypothetical protein
MNLIKILMFKLLNADERHDEKALNTINAFELKKTPLKEGAQDH